jgi:hypothetical protein
MSDARAHELSVAAAGPAEMEGKLFHAIALITVCAGHAGYYNNGPPVMAPPQYQYAAPPRRESSFLEGW